MSAGIAAAKAYELRALVRLFRERIEVRVAERDGGRFDISLEVDGLEIGYVNLLSEHPMGVHWGPGDRLMACDRSGELVPLPEGGAR